MIPAGLIPSPLLPPLCRLASRFVGKDAETVTGLSDEGWRALARKFPLLGANPGREASRARRILWLLSQAFADRRAPVSRLRGRPLSLSPTLYLTAHLGNLHMLRWELRRRGIAAATVLGPENLDRERNAARDQRFDRTFPIDFPHVFSSDRIHVLRAALKTGSLIIAMDRPTVTYAERPLLGGQIPLDPKPLRLASLMGVPARPVFLTAPEARTTLTVGDPVSLDDAERGLDEFAKIFDEVARESPHEFDGFTHRYLALDMPPPGEPG